MPKIASGSIFGLAAVFPIEWRVLNLKKRNPKSVSLLLVM